MIRCSDIKPSFLPTATLYRNDFIEDNILIYMQICAQMYSYGFWADITETVLVNIGDYWKDLLLKHYETIENLVPLFLYIFIL